MAVPWADLRVGEAGNASSADDVAARFEHRVCWSSVAYATLFLFLRSGCGGCGG